MQALQRELPYMAADIIDRLRTRRPHVHCITNAVAQTFTANLLLAAGAVPSMTIAPEEMADFVAKADALLVNLGTLDESRRAAIGIAVDTAIDHGAHWMLDPVFIDRSRTRASFAQALVRMHPTAIHLNAREFAELAAAEARPEALARFALKSNAVIAVTGETDLVADGVRLARTANGHPWMTKITAMGCAGAAIAAACLAVETEPWGAVAASLLLVGVAAEVAAERARGPGSLAVGIIDALHGLSEAELVARAKVT